jgi:hypothetical protein
MGSSPDGKNPRPEIVSARESKHARNSCGHHRPFIDFGLRVRANDPYEILRRFDQPNHSVFFLDQSQQSLLSDQPN